MEFSIGPSDEKTHNEVIDLLSKDNTCKIINISYNGDHYSEIFVNGDYNKLYESINKIKGVSIEHWED